MALLLVLLSTILAFSLASTDQCVSSPGSSMDLTLRSQKNASGHWIITVETRRLTIEEDTREISVKIHHETKICGKKEIEQLISAALVYPSLHDTSMSGAIESSTTKPTATTTSTTTTLPTTTSATTTPPTTTTTTSATTTPPTTPTNTSTNTPKSCPHSGYQLFAEFNCYKAFPSEGEWKTWREARRQCLRDGGDLMVVESERERDDVYIPLYNSVSWGAYEYPWLGVYIPKGGDEWTTVKGQPALSSWWFPGLPEKNAAHKCAQARSNGLLGNINSCRAARPFICEISL